MKNENKPESKAARYKKNMASKGFVQRSYWLSKDALDALDELRKRHAEEGKNKDALVDKAIRTLEALTPEEYREIHKRLNKL